MVRSDFDPLGQAMKTEPFLLGLDELNPVIRRCCRYSFREQRSRIDPQGPR